jgi:hypothetical protein
MEFVEGEVGAKAFQMPNNWPINTPIALWDSTDKKIFLKPWNQMGMANPLQELDYEIKNESSFVSGATQDMSQYVSKQDFEELKKEIHDLRDTMHNMSGVMNSSHGTVSNMSGGMNNNQGGRNRGGQQWIHYTT